MVMVKDSDNLTTTVQKSLSTIPGGGAHPHFAAIAANRPVRLRQKAASTIKLRKL